MGGQWQGLRHRTPCSGRGSPSATPPPTPLPTRSAALLRAAGNCTGNIDFKSLTSRFFEPGEGGIVELARGAQRETKEPLIGQGRIMMSGQESRAPAALARAVTK